MTAQTPIPGPHSAADGPTATPEDPGGVGTPNGAHRGDERNDAGLVAFIVRDLMDAAGYQYDPGQPLAEQARECGQIIRDFRECLASLQIQFDAGNQRYDADRQRLSDLVEGLRRHVVTRDRTIEVQRAELQGMRKIVMDKDEALEAAETRVDNLDQLLQERDQQTEAIDGRFANLDRTLRDAMSIPDLAEARAAGPDLGNDPDGDLEGADYPPFPAGTP